MSIGDTIFDVKSGDVRIHAFVDGQGAGDDNPQVWIIASLPEWIPAIERNNADTRKLPQIFREMGKEKEAKAAEVAIALVDGISRKLSQKGYRLRTFDDPDCKIKDEPMLLAAKPSRISKFSINASVNCCINAKPEFGLGADIKTAYEELLRENKALAAYMSREQETTRHA